MYESNDRRDPLPYRCGHCYQVSNWKHVIQVLQCPVINYRKVILIRLPPLSESSIHFQTISLNFLKKTMSLCPQVLPTISIRQLVNLSLKP